MSKITFQIKGDLEQISEIYTAPGDETAEQLTIVIEAESISKDDVMLVEDTLLTLNADQFKFMENGTMIKLEQGSRECGSEYSIWYTIDTGEHNISFNSPASVTVTPDVQTQENKAEPSEPEIVQPPIPAETIASDDQQEETAVSDGGAKIVCYRDVTPGKTSLLITGGDHIVLLSADNHSDKARVQGISGELKIEGKTDNIHSLGIDFKPNQDASEYALKPGEFVVIQGGYLNEDGTISADKYELTISTEYLANTKESLDAITIVQYYSGTVRQGAQIPTLAGAAMGAAIVAAAIAAFVTRAVTKKKYSRKKAAVPALPTAAAPAVREAPTQVEAYQPTGVLRPSALYISKLQNIGKRKSQQDSYAVAPLENGALAIVADGMGGLSDGDKVSQCIVQTMVADMAQFPANQRQGCLYNMLTHVNGVVNQMLGPTGIYKSGSTLLAVLMEQIGGKWSFQWVTVGDSRIYLYRDGCMVQINREHVYMRDLLLSAVRGEISFQEALSNSKRSSLTSFIGMGDLKYIDGSYTPVALRDNDVVLLMSDGVFNAVNEERMAEILSRYPNVDEAARVLENQVLAVQNPNQDNFTCVLMRIASAN